jgi:hypothetical protein
VNEMDALEILFGDWEETEADKALWESQAIKDAQESWARARNFRPELRAYNENVEAAEKEILAVLVELNSKRDSWIAKTYKENTKTIKFGDIDDDRDDRIASYSIGYINARRRHNNIEAFTKAIANALTALEYANKNVAEIARLTYNF